MSAGVWLKQHGVRKGEHRQAEGPVIQGLPLPPLAQVQVGIAVASPGGVRLWTLSGPQ